MEKVFVHPTAIIDAGAEIGPDTKIWHWTHVCGQDVKIGASCSLGQNVYVGNRVQIGRGVRIQNNVSVYDCVVLEDDVFCGPSVVFTNVVNPRAFISRKSEFKNTLVKKGATLGANATVVCGVEIGEFAFVGAGALINKSVKPFSLMVGVPARQLGWVCECGHTLTKDVKLSGPVQCKECDLKYTLDSGTCRKI